MIKMNFFGRTKKGIGEAIYLKEKLNMLQNVAKCVPFNNTFKNYKIIKLNQYYYFIIKT